MFKDLSELTAFLKICRKQGVLEIKYGDVSVKLGDTPKKSKDDADNQDIPTDELTPEQLMFYSAGGNE